MTRATTVSSSARGIWLLSLILWLTFGTQSVASAQPSTEARLRDLVERFFGAFCKKDVDGIKSVWSKESPELAGVVAKLTQTFANSERIELKSLTIRKAKVDGREASMRLVIDINAVEAKTGKPARDFGRINRTFHFVREGEEWKVWRYVASEEELAAELLQVKSETARDALLGAQRELLTAELVQALIARGRILANQAEYQGAMTVYELALGVADQLGDKTGIAKALNSIGTVYYWQGDYSEALARYQKSLKLAEELGDKAQLAASLGNIGLIYDSQGNYSRAFEYYERSLRLKEELGDKAGIARSLNNLGVVHRLQGDSSQALAYFQKSLKLKEELGDEVGIALSLSNIGIVLTRQGDYTRALDYLQKGLKLSEALHNEVSQALNLGNLGILCGLQGNYAEALEYFHRSLKIKQALGDKAGIATLLTNLGEVHFSQGRYTQAAEIFEQAATLAKQIELAEAVWPANAMAGRAYQATKQPTRALQSYLTAIDTIEELRGQVGGGEQEQQRSFETRLSAYHGMVDLLVEQNNAAEALLYAERAKGRVLLDVLQSGRINITKAMTADEREKEREMRAETVSLNVQLSRGRLRQPAGEARVSDLEARLQKARLEYEAFETGLYAAHPELKIQRGRMQPLTMDQISHLMPGTGAALLEFVVLEDKSFLFVLTGKANAGEAKVDLKVYTLPVTQKQLADLTLRFSQALAERRLSVQELAGKLYDLILKPARAQMQGLEALIIVPDDVLWQLPFQALKSSNHRYLIEDYSISYAPSLTVLGEMIKRRPEQDKATKGLPTLLAFGNPALGTETNERARAVHMGERLDPLPEAEKQVKLLGRLYGKAQSRIYTGSGAQEERFKAEAGNYRILHLATHGILNDASPMYSQLVLAQTGTREDGLLEAWEIMTLDLRADLVVLSACETARGRVGAGEGIIGLSWALFVAGAPTAIVSLWKVESASTTDLMLAFHRQIKSGSHRVRGPNSIAAALRLAALGLLKNKRYEHPFYWAPFVVIGNGAGSLDRRL